MFFILWKIHLDNMGYKILSYSYQLKKVYLYSGIYWNYFQRHHLLYIPWNVTFKGMEDHHGVVLSNIFSKKFCVSVVIDQDVS